MGERIGQNSVNSGERIKDMLNRESYCPEDIFNGKLVLEGKTVKSTRSTSDDVYTRGQYEITKGEPLNFHTAISSAHNSLLGGHRLRQGTLKSVVLSSAAIKFVKGEGAEIPPIIGKISTAVKNAGFVGMVAKFFFNDLPQLRDSVSDSKNEGKVFADEVHEKKNPHKAGVDKKNQIHVDQFEGRNGVERVVGRALKSIPLLHINVDKHFAGMEVRKARTYESLNLKVFDNVVEVFSSGGSVLAASIAFAGAMSVPYLGIVLSVFSFVRNSTDLFVSSRSLYKLCKLKNDPDAITRIAHNAMDSYEKDYDNKIVGSEKSDLEWLAKKELMLDLIYENNPLLTRDTNVGGSGRYDIGSKELRKKTVEVAIRDFLYESTDFRETVKKDQVLNTPEGIVDYIKKSGELSDLINAFGAIGADKVKERVLLNVERDIRAHYNERIYQFIEDKKVGECLNVVKVGCSAIPVVFSVGAIWFPPLSVAAGGFGFLSVGVVVVKLVHGKLQVYKGAETVHGAIKDEKGDYKDLLEVNKIAT